MKASRRPLPGWLLSCDPSNPEIGKLGSPELGDQYVCGFHIPMHDVLLPGERKRPGNVSAYCQHTCQRGTYRGQQLFQARSRHIFHDQGEVCTRLYNIVDLHHFVTVHTSH